MAMTKAQRARNRNIQRTCNAFSNKWLKGIKPLRVDGIRGRATNQRIMAIKWYCGWGKKRNASWTSLVVRRIRHPKSAKYFPKNKVMLRTGAKRRGAQRRAHTRQQIRAVFTPGVTRYDGVPCAKWMVPYPAFARRYGWPGRLVSGWRSPAYSDSLCRRICGRPRCPGICAGRASNHAGSARPRGALDVSAYGNFGWHMRRCPLSPRIFNGLGRRDPVHFSQSGN